MIHLDEQRKHEVLNRAEEILSYFNFIRANPALTQDTCKICLNS